MSVATDTEGKITAVPGAQYFLPCDEKERERLNIQHFKFKELMDNKLIFVPVAFQPDDAVLDSATGTGIWLLDFSTTVPNSLSLHGVDIETRNFPPPTTCTSNIHFREGSILSLPVEWTSKFALLNQKFVFQSAIPVPDVPIVLFEFYRVLKPGGWMQLIEFGDFGDSTAGPYTEVHLRKLMENFATARGLDLNIHKYLSQLIEEAGFEEISTSVYRIPHGKWAGPMGEWARDNFWDVWGRTRNLVIDGNGFGVVESGKQFDELLENVVKEWDETPGAGADMVVFRAKKPV